MIRSAEKWSRLLLAVVGCFALSVIAAPSAFASLQFSELGVDVSREDGSFSRQAGEASDFSFRFEFPDGSTEDPRDVDLALPPGFVGNPVPFPTCTLASLFVNACPTEAQVGVVDVKLGGRDYIVHAGLFNLSHGPDVPALFAFKFTTSVATITPRIRAGDYGLSSGSFEIAQAERVESATLHIWGVPASHSHDRERQIPGGIEAASEAESVGPFVPFFSNPTSCPETPTPFTARGDSWQEPGVFDEGTLTADENGVPFLWEGCESLPFNPKLAVSPGSHRAHSPSGLSVDLSLPYVNSPAGLQEAMLKETAITFPEGMTISPAAAAGQAGCSQAQVQLGNNEPPACPASSRIGSVSIKSQLLEETLSGEVVLASQNDNPFGSTYAVYLLAKGPGFYLKLPGKLTADSQTGQLRTVFSNLPQLPFEHMHLELRGGPTAPLQTPNACGDYSAQAELASWAQPDRSLVEQLPIKIDENCDSGAFDPDLRGGVANPVAGARSPLTVEVLRQDGEQNLSRIGITLPEGQVASLKDIAECPEAKAATAACPTASQIGVATATVGSGSSPLVVPQPGKQPTVLYLGGPYNGAPLSMIARVPAQAGPFDFGNIVVRTALHVDPTTTQVSAQSEPLPQFIEGVPLQYRDIRIELTRPDFAVVPTNCEKKAITSTLTSATGTAAHPSVPYQVEGCSGLGFKPKLKLALKGKLKRTANPAFSATLKAQPGQANIAKTTVILPKSEFIDNAHIASPCTRVQFNAGNCPKGSILGNAKAYTPLLDQPLTGPVYFRSNGGERELPDIVADLNGQIHVTLVGFIDSVKAGKEGGRVRTRFMNVPDAPVSKFQIHLFGGKRGLIQNSLNLCSFTPKAKVQMTGQNGKTANSNVKLGTSCGKKRKK
jgi:hypothetical protein